MSYRKITVDGKEYEYVVGKTHLKIKGVGAFLKEATLPKYDVIEFCDCCYEPLKDLYPNYEYQKHVQAHPAMIASLIRNPIGAL